MRGSESRFRRCLSRLVAVLAAVALIAFGAASSFAQEATDLPVDSETRVAPTVAVSMTSAEVQARIDAMSAVEREELALRQARFDGATAEERQKYRDMHAKVAADPAGEELVGIAHRYAEWVATLTPDDRRTLLTLPAAERVAMVKELMKSEESRQFALLVSTEVADEDYKAIAGWFREYAYANVDRFREVIPTVAWDWIKHEDDDKRWFAMMMAYRSNSKDDLPIPKPESADLARLAASLTPSTRAAFERAGDDVRKMRLLEEWGRAAAMARFRPVIAKEDLWAFYRDKLSPAVRAELDKLPSDELPRRLRMLYIVTQRRETPDDRVELEEAKMILDPRGRFPFPGGPRTGGPPFERFGPGRGPMGPDGFGPGPPGSRPEDGPPDGPGERGGSHDDHRHGPSDDRHGPPDRDREGHGGDRRPPEGPRPGGPPPPPESF